MSYNICRYFFQKNFKKYRITADYRNCYKCIRHCPVKSIRFNDNHAYIVAEECMLCGRCLVVCLQNAKEVRSDIETARALVREAAQTGTGVYASLDPSFAANYRDEKSGLPLTAASLERSYSARCVNALLKCRPAPTAR
jgi:Fe-S-cluster-containing hydrogenase component 2